LLGQAVNPELVARVRANDGQAQTFGQLARATGVVNMGVGEPDLFELEAQPFDLCQDFVQITTWVNDRRLQGLVAPDQRAILVKGGDGNGEVLKHGGRWGLQRTNGQKEPERSILGIRMAQSGAYRQEQPFCLL